MLFFVGLAFTLIYWGIGVILILIISWLSRIFNKEEKHLELGYAAGTTFFKGFFTGLTWMRILKIHDDDLSPYCDSESPPLIIASNHPALWDAPLLLRRFPRISGIMKAEILHNPILKGGAPFIGFLPNQPTITMVRTAKKRLAHNAQLLLFPEGTRTRGKENQLNPFQSGIGFLAKQNNIPVLPVFIHMNTNYLQKGWPIWKIPTMPIEVSIQVGEIKRLAPKEKSKEFTRRLEKYFQKSVLSKKPWI